MTINRTSRFQKWFRNESAPVVVTKPTSLTDAEFADRVYTIYWYGEPTLNGGTPTMTWVGITSAVDNTVTFSFPPSDVNRTGVLHWQAWRHLVSNTSDVKIVGSGATEFADGLRP